MLVKEFKNMLKSPAYILLLFLPFILTFFLGEGTQGYLLQFKEESTEVISQIPIILYDGDILDTFSQFAVSELSFTLMMTSVLLGLNVFEERKLHVWDRIVDKNRFLMIKFCLHYIFCLTIIALSTILYQSVLDISLSLTAILLFCSIPFVSLSFGMLMGITVSTVAVLSNTILMVVMLCGYLGGALSLTSVLSNTFFMNVLMYLSPLTIVNKLVFLEMLNEPLMSSFITWCIVDVVLTISCLFLTKRRVQRGSIL